MDSRIIKSDLLALERLYSLLVSDGDCMTNPASDMLDQHARLILKCLLDSATQSALKVYSKMLSGQMEALRAPGASCLQQTDNPSKERPSLFRNLSLTTEVDQSCRNGLGSDEERKMDSLDFNLWSGKRFIRQRSQADTVEQSTPITDASGAEFRKKRCRICRRSTLKQIVIDDDTAKISDVLTNSKHLQNSDQRNISNHIPWSIEQETGSILLSRTDESKTDKGRQIGPYVNNLNGVGSTGFSSDTLVPDINKVCDSNFEVIYKREEADSISKEASKAIEQLESCISDLNIGSDHMNLSRKFSAQHENMDSKDKLYQFMGQSAPSPVNYSSYPVFSVSLEETNQPSAQVQSTNSMLCQSNDHFVRSGKNYEIRESNEKTKMPIHGQKVKTIVENIESGNWRTAHNDHGPNQIQNVWNISVAADRKTSPWASTFSFVPKMESSHQNHSAMKYEKNRHGRCQPSKPADTFGLPNYSKKLQSVDSSCNTTSNWEAHGKKHTVKTTGKVLPDYSHQSDLHHKRVVATNRNSTTASRMSLNQPESEDTASSSYSSNMSSRQASSYGSVNEDYSFSGQSGSRSITSSTGSDDGASAQSRRTTREYDSHTSKSEDRFYSSTSGDTARDVSFCSGSKSEGYSSYNQPINYHAGSTYSSMESISRKKAPGKINKSFSGINHKKRSKTWKRLKDRLAIIFHHHHHHHHHHHDSHDDNHHGSRWRKMNVGTLFKRHNGKVTRSKKGDEVYRERAVETTRKSLMHDKYKKGHFHGLVEGFLRHIWRSKKSKPARKITGKLAKHQQGRKKTLKGSQWWKLLQHRRRRDFPNKARVKLGLGKKKTHLKALPKLR